MLSVVDALMRIVLTAIFFVLLGSGTNAAYRGQGPAPINNTVLVGAPQCGSEFAFLNLMKCAGSQQSPSHPEFPGAFDADGYPNNASGNPLPATIIEDVTLPPDFCNYRWGIRWTGTMGTNALPGFKMQGPGTASPRITVIDGGAFVSSNNLPAQEMDLFGTNGLVHFTFNNCVPTNPSQGSNANTSSGWLSGASFGANVGGGTTLSNLQLYPCKPTFPGYVSATPCSAVEAALVANPNALNPDYITLVTRMNPGWSRIQIGNFNNITLAAYRMRPTAFSYVNPVWVPSQWAGQITCPSPSGGVCGTDKYNATLVGATVVDGFMVQGYAQAAISTRSPYFCVNNANCAPIQNFGSGTQTAYTASISDGGDSNACTAGAAYSGVAGTCMIVTGTPGVPIVSGSGSGSGILGQNVLPGTTVVSQQTGTTGSSGNYTVSQSNLAASASVSQFGIGSIAANQQFTVTWDAAMQVWEYTSNGVLDYYPLEVLAQIANATHTNLWFSRPILYTFGTMQTATQVLLSNLNSNLNLGLELCNEEWNSAFDCFAYAEQYGQTVLGLAVSGDNTLNGYYAVQSKRMLDAAGASVNSRVKGILAAQYFGQEWGPYQSIRFQGSLACGTSCSNSTYAANVGVICGQATCDYNSSPNRPIDEASYIAAAPYTQGSNFFYAATNGYILTTGVASSAFTTGSTTVTAPSTFGGGCNAIGSGTAVIDATTGQSLGTASGCTGSGVISFQSGHPAANGSMGDVIISNWNALTNNFANVATAADDWAAGNTSAAYTIISADLAGSASQQIPVQHTNFALTSPTLANYNSIGLALNPVAIGTLTANTTGSSTTVVITGLSTGSPSVSGGTLIADPVLGTLLFGGGTASGTILTAQQSGTPGGNGTYTMSIANSFTSATVSYSGGWLSNWEQVTENEAATSARSIKFLPYEQAPQLTSPRISDCSAMGSGELFTSPKYYCINAAGGNGQSSVAGYQVGDVLSSTANSLTGFGFTIDTVAPDGTPLTGHVSAVGSGMTTNATAVSLTGGHGFNITADIAESGGSVTGVTLYSQVVSQMLLAYEQSTNFKATELALYALQMAQPSTIGVAQTDFAGYTPNSNPWALYYANIYGTQLQLYQALCQQDGTTC